MAESDRNEIYLSSSPHYSVPLTTSHVMFAVVTALLPIAAFGVWLYGIPALVTIVVSVACTVGFEAGFRALTKQDIRVGDYSAVITGLLLALVLPPSTPVWMTVLGAFFSIVIAKEFFGGLGANVFNPALSGRAFLLVSFATSLTKWTKPFTGLDAVSAATTLSYVKPGENPVLDAGAIAAKLGLTSAPDVYLKLFLGQRAGSIGESPVFLILIAFVLLVAAKVIDWRAPVSMMATAVAVSWIAGIDPLISLLSGGLVFGAVFMATDYATSPVTPMGRIIFGIGCGLITGLIRVAGGYPEGVMFSILIMNSVVPFLNRIIVKKYGWVKPAKPAKAAAAGAAQGGAK